MVKILREGCMCSHAWGVRVGNVWQVGGQKLKVNDDCKFHAGMTAWAADEFDEIERNNNG